MTQAGVGSIVGHGIDVVEVARVAELVERHGERFLARCFGPAERAYAESRSPRRRAEHLAARFAAKEAALKVLGTGLRGGICWTDIEVVRDGAGCPSLRLSGRAGEVAAERGIASWHLSLTHTATLAYASAIGTRD